MHSSVYAFRRRDLLDFTRMKESPLEKLEKLEMLRAMQAGWTMRIVPIAEVHPEVDEPADIKIVEKIMLKKYKSYFPH